MNDTASFQTTAYVVVAFPRKGADYNIVPFNDLDNPVGSQTTRRYACNTATHVINTLWGDDDDLDDVDTKILHRIICQSIREMRKSGKCDGVLISPSATIAPWNVRAGSEST